MSAYYCPSCDDWHDADWVFPVLDDEGDIIACDDCYDPTPWCHICGSMTKQGCKCGPIAENH